MLEIVLDGANWRTRDDFYEDFLKAVGAPGWHGRNLDALNDSIGAGSINEVEIPYVVIVRGLSSMSPEARQMVERFCGLIRDLRGDGVEVDVRCE